MNLLRAIIKAIGFCLLIGGFYLLWLAGFAFVFLFEGITRQWRNFVFRNWAKMMVRLLGLKMTVSGIPPAPPFMLVSNHLSYLDVIVYAARLDCVFVAKREVAGWPILGMMCRSIDTIFLDRHSRRDLARVNELIDRTFSAGQGIVLFPEGTSTCGEKVLPFKTGLLETAARTGQPVSWASLSYRTAADEQPAHESVCWWGEMTFLPHLFDLFRLSEIRTTLHFGADPVMEEDRKLLAEKLHREVQKNFVPVVRLSSEQLSGATIAASPIQYRQKDEASCVQ
jgi:1-acyl-sn-glycerol-3-phosphate acyltransferase